MKMPTYPSEQFLEWQHGEFLCHRFDFTIGDHEFLVIFSPVDVTDEEYQAFRSEEVGFSVPEGSYYVKFDRVDNFDSGDFYARPEEGYGRGMAFLNELSYALTHIISLHCCTYQAKAYLLVAEDIRLKTYYDRILQRRFDEVLYKVTTDLGDEGKGYALKTRYYYS